MSALWLFGSNGLIYRIIFFEARLVEIPMMVPPDLYFHEPMQGMGAVRSGERHSSLARLGATVLRDRNAGEASTILGSPFSIGATI